MIYPNSQEVDTLIVTPLKEELQSILHHLDSPEKVHSTNYAYTAYHASVGTHRVAVVSLIKMGNIEAAITTQQAIEELRPQNVIVMGIAAGISNKVNLGDVIVGTSSAYYELAKQRNGTLESRPQHISVDSTLLDYAQNIRSATWAEMIEIDRPIADGNIPQLKFGQILSGEKVVDDGDQVNELLKLFPTAIAIEMESYGVANVINNIRIPPRLILIRGISDHAKDKNDNWRDYAAAAAAAFTYYFVETEFADGNHINNGEQASNSFVLIRHESTNPVSPEYLRSSLSNVIENGILGEIHVNQLASFPDQSLFPISSPLEAQFDLRHQVDNWRKSASNLGLIYYGLPHVPLAFWAGHQLEKLPIDFYEVDRYNPAKFWRVEDRPSSFPQLIEDSPLIEPTNESGDVLVRISISYEVALTDLVDFPQEFIGCAHLRLDNLVRDGVRTVGQMQNYSRKFRDLLDNIYQVFPNLNSIHIMYAGPVALAVSFGQQISPRMDAPIYVYNYNSKAMPHYNWAIQLNGQNAPQYHSIKSQ